MPRARLLASFACGCACVWVACASAGPAVASGTIACASPEGDATVELAIGSLPVLAVVGARIIAGERAFALVRDGDVVGDEAEPVVVGQAFRDRDRLLVDFTDPNIESVLVSLRIVETSEERDLASAGTLTVSGVGAWPLTCIGP